MAAPCEIEQELLRIRESVNRNTTAAGSLLPTPHGLQESTHLTTSFDESILKIQRFVPQSVLQSNARTRALVFAFGGAYVGGSVDVFRGFIMQVAERSETQVFAPQWRIAPEHPFPAGVEDVFAAIKWLQANAAEFNIDPARIIVMGPSAGGTLAAAVALMARDRGLDPPLAAQVLRYPSLSDESAEFDPNLQKYQTWGQEQHKIVWKAYTGGGLNESDRGSLCYAAPARADNLTGLPPAHIGVGEYDFLLEECRTYAKRLGEAGVDVEYFSYPECPHGFDGFPGSVQGRLMWDREASFIKRF